LKRQFGDKMKIAIVGYGKMGQLLKKTIDEAQDLECVGIISSKHRKDLCEIEEDIDVIIDFSNPANLNKIGSYVENNPVALVLATTGYSENQTKYVEKLATKVPVVFTANFSLGITILQQVVKQTAPILKDSFDIEIIEKHHNLKLDAPSGTAKLLLKALDEDQNFERVYGREGNKKRSKEIGIHTIRGGTIVGEHTVIFAGQDEILEFTHQAHSKQIFVNGAIKAARFGVEQQPGLYDMTNVLFG